MSDATANDDDPHDGWAARIAAFDRPPAAKPPRKAPITVDRIVDTALAIIEAEGFDALTMRRVAVDLETGPASLYAHVHNKAELDDLVIGRLCRHVELPTPDAAGWQEQMMHVCRQLRDQFLRYPGVSRAALAAAPNSVDTMRINEGMLAILLAAGVPPRSAAWTIDAAYLYVSAYCLESSLRREPGTAADARALTTQQLVARLRMLPADRFPNTVAHAQELASGEGHERFDFTLGVLFRGVAEPSD